ncbi:MAG: hypothetical protein AAFU03_07685 [Bacteroidota bacterium]
MKNSRILSFFFFILLLVSASSLVYLHQSTQLTSAEKATHLFVDRTSPLSAGTNVVNVIFSHVQRLLTQ